MPAPVIQTAAWNAAGTIITVQFDRAVHFGNTGDFTLTVNGLEATFLKDLASGNTQVRLFTISQAPDKSQETRLNTFADAVQDASDNTPNDSDENRLVSNALLPVNFKSNHWRHQRQGRQLRHLP
jgi:hypothetical protein